MVNKRKGNMSICLFVYIKNLFLNIQGYSTQKTKVCVIPFFSSQLIFDFSHPPSIFFLHSYFCCETKTIQLSFYT